MGVLQDFTATDVQNRVNGYLAASGLTASAPAPTVTYSKVPISGGGPSISVVKVVVQYPHQFVFLGPAAALFGGSSAREYHAGGVVHDAARGRRCTVEHRTTGEFMSRNTRTFVVMAIAIALAAAASFGVYRAIKQIPVREVEVAHHSAVVASHDLPLGTLVTKEDVKLVPWPSSDPLPGGFDTIEKVLNRGVVAPVMTNEPLAESKLAPIEAGAGLPPTIPTGMRAISVKVNEVIGVAGFTVPGTRVDVLAMIREQQRLACRESSSANV